MLRFTLIVLGLALASACADPAARIRQATYPPEFKYVTKEEFQTSMWRLAEYFERLDMALTAPEPPGPIDQHEVTAALADIERSAKGILASDGGSNRPFLQNHMARFLDTVQQARFAARQNPPRYHAAENLSSACAHCHTLNR